MKKLTNLDKYFYAVIEKSVLENNLNIRNIKQYKFLFQKYLHFIVIVCKIFITNI